MAIDAIARNKAEALIREQLVNTIQQDVPKSSIVMQLGTRLANMTSNQTKIPVLSMLPLAYWVNGDTGMKKTSKQEWDNVYMTAAELAVIVPVPEAVLADSSFDIMGEVQPRVREAMGAKIDNAILFGGDRPTEWTTDVLTLAAKNKVTGSRPSSPSTTSHIRASTAPISWRIPAASAAVTSTSWSTMAAPTL